jgi:hypothetical protein
VQTVTINSTKSRESSAWEVEETADLASVLDLVVVEDVSINVEDDDGESVISLGRCDDDDDEKEEMVGDLEIASDEEDVANLLKFVGANGGEYVDCMEFVNKRDKFSSSASVDFCEVIDDKGNSDMVEEVTIDVFGLRFPEKFIFFVLVLFFFVVCFFKCKCK